MNSHTYLIAISICNSILHYFYLFIFFGEVSTQIFSPFLTWIVFLLLSFKCFCILYACPLSDTYFANIISQSVTCILIFLSAFYRAEVFNFNKVQLYPFSSHDYAYGIVSKNPQPPRFSVIFQNFVVCFVHLGL